PIHMTWHSIRHGVHHPAILLIPHHVGSRLGHHQTRPFVDDQLVGLILRGRRLFDNNVVVVFPLFDLIQGQTSIRRQTHIPTCDVEGVVHLNSAAITTIRRASAGEHYGAHSRSHVRAVSHSPAHSAAAAAAHSTAHLGVKGRHRRNQHEHRSEREEYQQHAMSLMSAQHFNSSFDPSFYEMTQPSHADSLACPELECSDARHAGL